MSFIYVHLSDIHFGQEDDGQVVVNDDVKDQILIDVQGFLSELPGKRATGIIISGDIAYAGKAEEYEKAGLWLDRLTAASGCERTAVQLVPGNHDVDLTEISYGSQMMIEEVFKNGDVALDKFLSKEIDREMLYQKFSAYRIFAEAYNCPLETDGSISGHRRVEILPGKFLAFTGLNTSLLCSKSKEEEGNLLLGKRQRVIRQQENTEQIVIAHHPLHWLKDSDDALLYLKNRARVFISGHEHKPGHNFEPINDVKGLLSISSGAAAPPNVSDEYTYCYNILEFSWNQHSGKLIVNIHPRIWNNQDKSFVDDQVNFKSDKCIFELECPNFKIEHSVNKVAEGHPVGIKKPDEQIEESYFEEIMLEDEEQTLLLKFFRELSSTQRLLVLVEMKILPEKLNIPITHTIESKALRSLFKDGKADELNEKINSILSTKLDKSHE